VETYQFKRFSHNWQTRVQFRRQARPEEFKSWYSQLYVQHLKGLGLVRDRPASSLVMTLGKALKSTLNGIAQLSLPF